MSKHPLKQTDEEIYQETYGQYADAKAKALADKAVRDKYDATAPKYNPSFNDSTLVDADYIPKPLQSVPKKPLFVQRFKNFSTKVKNFLSDHADRYKKQREIPMPTFGGDPKDPK